MMGLRTLFYGGHVMPIFVLILGLSLLAGCNQYKEYDCDKISLAVVTDIENNNTLTGSELALAVHLYETVPARGNYLVHSYDEVFRACQQVKYDPNSPL